jgi:hypothetical protein
MKFLVPPIEIRSALEREAYECTLAAQAIEWGLEAANIAALPKRTQEIISKLKEMVQ